MRSSRFLFVLILTLGFSTTLYARHRSAPAQPVTEVEGVLKSITSTQLVVTDSHKQDVTINITPQTVFRKGDFVLDPTTLKTGDRVEIKATHTATGLDALVVEVQNAEENPLLVEVAGAIKSVSSSQLVVTDAKQNDTTFMITPDTIIRKGSLPATTGDLAVGDRVEVKAIQTSSGLTALFIRDDNEAEQEPQLLEVSGTIKSVSSSEIVVTDSKGNDTTFEITPTTVIRRNGRAATAGDLMKGDSAEVKAMVNGTTNTAVSINAESPEQENEQDVEISGKVSAVGSNSITVTTSSGDVKVNIDSNTRIREGGKTVAIGDIHVGDRVEAEGMRVDATTILAKSISVEKPEGDD